jgi:hypothetical protein
MSAVTAFRARLIRVCPTHHRRVVPKATSEPAITSHGLRLDMGTGESDIEDEI